MTMQRGIHWDIGEPNHLRGNSPHVFIMLTRSAMTSLTQVGWTLGIETVACMQLVCRLSCHQDYTVGLLFIIIIIFRFCCS